MDARAGQSFLEVTDVIAGLKERGYHIEILFMDCSEATLIKRYKESRRVHPLAVEGRIEDGVSKEREILKDIHKMSDYVIDSSKLLTRELKEELDRIFVTGEGYNNLIVTVMSFGFKHGIPSDADLVFDVRFLPNPYIAPQMLSRTSGLSVSSCLSNCFIRIRLLSFSNGHAFSCFS